MDPYIIDIWYGQIYGGSCYNPIKYLAEALSSVTFISTVLHTLSMVI